MPRVAVFIDNSNVYKNLRAQCITSPEGTWCMQYDPLHLSKALCGGRELIWVGFYCAAPPEYLLNDNPKAHASQNSYYTQIAKLENVEVKLATLTHNNGVYSEKNLDTQLTADVIMKAAANEYDHAIIISNDGDFVSAIEAARQLNKKVEVAHFKNKMSMNLRKSADITRRLRPKYFRSIHEEQRQQSIEGI